MYLHNARVPRTKKRSDSRSQVRQHSFVTGPPQVTKMCTKNILRLWPLPTGLARPYTVPRLSDEMHGIIGDVGFRATVVCLSSPNLFGDCDLACSDVSTPRIFDLDWPGGGGNRIWRPLYDLLLLLAACLYYLQAPILTPLTLKLVVKVRHLLYSIVPPRHSCNFFSHFPILNCQASIHFIR